jgi:hypothetical protein
MKRAPGVRERAGLGRHRLGAETDYGQGFVVGQGTGVLFGNWQQTETHWLPVTTTVAVLVSVVPVPTSMPAAAPPSFSVTPNHGSMPMTKEELAGVATIVAVLPEVTDAVTVASVDPVAPLIATEHQFLKFKTVSTGPVLIASVAVESALLASRAVLASSAWLASTAVASAAFASATAASTLEDESSPLLLQATVLAIASAATAPTVVQFIRLIVSIGNSPIRRVLAPRRAAL